jgi:hypothetical protein
MSNPRRDTLAAVLLLIIACLSPVAAAQEGPAAERLELTPETGAAPSGTCKELTARVTTFGDAEGDPLAGVTVDVAQVLVAAGSEPGEVRELSSCNPVKGPGANPTGQGGTVFRDVSGNNPGSTAGERGRNTAVRAEVGPTDGNGKVTFGISMLPVTSGGSVSVSAWVDTIFPDDEPGEGEPVDTSTSTWNAQEAPAAGMTVDAAPESATLDNGTRHEVTVLMTEDGDPLQGVVPNSVVVADGSGRPGGDVANPSSGPSPNDVAGKPKPNAYTCTASDAGGLSTCFWDDPAGTGPGTDTVVFYVNRAGGTVDPDAGEPQDAVQVTWRTPEPRHVQLCHGTATGAACDAGVRELSLGDVHTVSVLVTDQLGNPMDDIPVELRETGPAGFTPGGTDSVVVTTGANGIATATLDAEGLGTSNLVAEIGPAGVPGGIRSPGTADDECERPAGSTGTPPAGNCTASLTVAWSTMPHDDQCDDGLDNDEDGLVDEEDSGCDDGTEEPVDHLDQRHPRRINMRFRDGAGTDDEGLEIFGRLRLVGGDDRFRACTAGQPVRIQRRGAGGGWRTLKSLSTNRRGRYAGVVLDRAAEYRALAPRSEVVREPQNAFHVCGRARKAKTHNHR